jgi:hypothetical protein
MYQDATTGVLKNADYGGSLAWQGASRDVLEVTLFTGSSSRVLEGPFDLTISTSCITRTSSTEEGMTIEVASPVVRHLWSGGSWN